MTIRVVEADPPDGALLDRYRGGGGYTDCFVAVVPDRVTQTAYIEVFYTTALFKLERFVLALLVSRPSTDDEARRLAAGETERFAAWTVEAREADQILLCDFMGSTRSWLMSVADPAAPSPTTRLYFGSAIVPRRGGGGPGSGFRVMVPFHRLYARALLKAAVRRLMSS
jgi:hypothetical protein